MKKYVLIIFVCLLSVVSCTKKVNPTTVEVLNPLRHYFPLVLGEQLKFSYELTNTGKEPFVISDIQPSCGCIVEGDNNERIILPGKSLLLHFVFDSGKNRGYVRQAIRIYGNGKPKGMIALVFDVNIVSPTDRDMDYEELFQEKKDQESGMSLDEEVNGKHNEKGYWIKNE